MQPVQHIFPRTRSRVNFFFNSATELHRPYLLTRETHHSKSPKTTQRAGSRLAGVVEAGSTDQNEKNACRKIRRAAELVGEANMPPASCVDTPNREPGPLTPLPSGVGMMVPDGVP